jgi:hypothetical protein
MKRSEDHVGAKPQFDAEPSSDVVINPLRKRRLSGELYERDPKINALISSGPTTCVLTARLGTTRSPSSAKRSVR